MIRYDTILYDIIRYDTFRVAGRVGERPRGNTAAGRHPPTDHPRGNTR